MAVTYYYGDPRMFRGYSSARPDDNSLLDYWFYPDRHFMDDVSREQERLAEANKKKEGEGKGKGGGGGGGGGKKGGGGGEGGDKKDGDNKEGGGGEKKEGGGGKKQPKVFELKASLCCDSCARKMKRKIEKLDGVESVNCDVYEKKVTVTAAADTKPETVLKRAQKVKKDTVMWPKKEGEKKEGDAKKEGGNKKKNEEKD